MRKLIFEEIAKLRLTPDQAINADRHPVIGILEDVRSLYNVGSCFRTADAMLLHELVLTGFTPTPPRSEIDKTALGATTSVPWRSASDTVGVIDQLHENGWKVFALEITDESIPLPRVADLEASIAFVVGNELTGLRPETVAACDGSFEIPMFGAKHSLNVAVAFGIAAWECIRNRRRTERGPTT